MRITCIAALLLAGCASESATLGDPRTSDDDTYGWDKPRVTEAEIKSDDEDCRDKPPNVPLSVQASYYLNCMQHRGYKWVPKK